MTVRARIVSLIRRLRPLLDLDGNLGPLFIRNGIQLVREVGQDLADGLALGAAGNLTAAAGTPVWYHTCPADTVWRVKTIARDGTTAVTRVVVYASGFTVYVTESSTSAASVRTDILLRAGDAVGLLTTGNAGDSARRLDIVYDAWAGSR